MELCAIFKSIQNVALDPTELANEFIEAKHPPDYVNLQLTQLLMCSAGIKEKIGENLVKESQIDEIHEFVNTKTKDLRQSTIPLHNDKYFQRCLKFFERIFVLDWNTFMNGGHFNAYFIKLLEELSECEPTMMHVLCFSIRLKVVTAYLRGGGIVDQYKYMAQVKSYAKIMTDKAVFYKSTQCAISACTELYEWIKKDDSFASDKNLRLIVWCAKLEKPKLVCHALLIAYSVLRYDHLREKLKLFVRSLVAVFEELYKTKNNKVFDCICRCCELIYKYHKEAILPPFLENLLDNLFAEDRNRAKSAAGFWISSYFDRNCHRKNIRTILNFLQGKGVGLSKVLIDSIIDEYPTLVDFEALVGMVLDDDNSVLEEDKLTMAEKEGLLSLMSFTIEEMVSGFPPPGRAEKVKTLSLAASHEYACQVSSTIIPRFWDMFNLPFINAEKAQITLILMAKFSNFEMLDCETMISLVKQCYVMFTETSQPYCLNVVLDFLQMVKRHVRNPEVEEVCNETFKVLKTWCEAQLSDVIDDLINDPDKYEDWNSKAAKTAEAIAIRVMALNRFEKLSRKCLFVNPRRMLEFENKPRSRIFICVLYVCVDLICEYIILIASWLKKVYDEPKYKLSELDEYVTEVEYVVKTLSIKLQEWYAWRELSNATFVNLCKVLEEVKSLPFADENKWNALLPQDARFLIAGYVAARVWNTQDYVEADVKTYILKMYLNLIENRILPLSQAYDAMNFLNTQREVMQAPLRKFISHVYETEEAATVVDWLLNWLKCMFRIQPEACSRIVGEFVDLVLPMRKEMQNIISECVRKGIDFALSDIQLAGSESSASSSGLFLNVLVTLSHCLDDNRKRAIEKSFKDKTFKKNNAKAMKNFFKCLRKRPAPRKPVEPSSIPEVQPNQSPILSSHRVSQFTLEESEPPFSPSSITQSSAVMGDESNAESWSSGDVSLFMTRPTDSPNVVHSRMMNENHTQAETESLQYDCVKELVDRLRMEAASEAMKGEASSVSSGVDDISNQLNNAAIRVEGTPSTHDTTTNLENTTPVGDFNAGSSSSILSTDYKPLETAINETDFTVKGQFRSSRVVSIPISPPSLETSPAKSNATSYEIHSKTATSKDYILDSSPSQTLSSGDDDLMKKRLNSSISDTDSTAAKSTPKQNVTQAENDVPTIDELVQYVKFPNTESSSALASSGEDDAMKDLLNESISSTDTLVGSPKYYTPPTASPIHSPQKKPTDIRAESTLQLYESIVKCVNVLEGEKSSASAISDDNDVLKWMSNVSVTGTDSLAQTAKKPSRSPQTKQTDIQPETSMSQTYDNLAKFVNRLEGKDSSASEIDLSNASFGEADLNDTYVLKPTNSSNEDTRDLLSILESEEDEQPDSFGEVGNVTRNLQRVSLSNDDTDASNLSSVSGTPPIKRRRQLDN